MRRRLILALLLGGGLAGCGSSGNDDGTSAATDNGATSTTETSTTSGELRPADEVRISERFGRMTHHQFGDEVVVGDVALTISGAEVISDDLGGMLKVTVHVENRGDTSDSIPNIQIECASSEETGSWQADSTIGLGDELPAKTFDDGFVNLTLPEDGRYGEPVPECVGPSVISTTPVVSLSNSPIEVWDMPDDLRVELNDAAANGPGLTPASKPAPAIQVATTTSVVESTEPSPAVDAKRGDELKNADQASAALAGAGLDCALTLNPEEPNAMAPLVEIVPVEYSCPAADGWTISVSFYESSDDREAGLAATIAAYGPMMRGFGINELALAYHDEGSWIAGVNPAEGNEAEPSDTNLALLEQVSDALDGEIHEIKL